MPDLKDSDGEQTPTNRLSCLAPELLNKVLRLVRYTVTRDDFTSCLLVCRQWTEIARPIAWNSVCLGNNNLGTFVRTTRPYSQVKSLTLHLNTIWPTQLTPVEFPSHLRGVSVGTAQLWEELELLADIIKSSMLKLTSFSLQIDKFPLGGRTKQHINQPHGGWMRSTSIVRLLDQLPASCIDLELDTKGREDDTTCNYHPSYGSAHICSSIQALLPRLRHLRLRLGSMCPSLFFADPRPSKPFTVAPHLLSLIINLDLEPASKTMECAYKRTCTPQKLPVENYTFKSLYSGDVIPPRNLDNISQDNQELALYIGKSLQRAYSTEHLPQAKLVQVMDLLSNADVQHDCFSQQDIIHEVIYRLPFRMVSTGDGTLDDRTFLARDKSDREFIGLRSEMEAILEGDTWVTTDEGHRLTRDALSSLGTTNEREPRYETRTDFLNRCGDGVLPQWETAKDCHTNFQENAKEA